MPVMFGVYATPVPKARPRVTKHGTYTPRKTLNYEALVSKCARAEMVGRDIFTKDTPLKCTIIICVQVPKSWSAKKKDAACNGVIRPTTRPDIDNYVKSITDACNGIVYEDDSQIVDLRAVLKYVESPHALVTIEPIIVR